MENITFEELFTYSNLYHSYLKSRKCVQWKGTVQAFKCSAISRLYEMKRKIRNDTFKTGKFHCFTIMERGKLRQIKSVNIEERILQRCLCDFVLVPTLTRKFIYDNSACVKGKGTHFALKRMKTLLHRHWRKYGNKGYILQWDYHHYFDTLPHDQIKKSVMPLIKDKRIANLYGRLVDDFPDELGLGLGSQISQISALYYPHKIDNLFAYKKGISGMGRFMDDGYVIAKDKAVLRECLEILKIKSEELGLTLNAKKTRIRKLNGVFPYLKARITLAEDGRILAKPNQRNVTRNRRKLRKLWKMVEEGSLTFDEIKTVYKTTYGNLGNFDANRTKMRYLGLMNDLMKGMKNVYLLQDIRQKSH